MKKIVNILMTVVIISSTMSTFAITSAKAGYWQTTPGYGGSTITRYHREGIDSYRRSW
jgi:hypothetical protein